VIELGRALAPLPEAARTEANRVRGCASKVWLATAVKGATATAGATTCYRAGPHRDPLCIYSGQCADQIVRTDAQGLFRRLGLAEHLTPQRSNGFASMVERICADSRRAMSGEARTA
jgi:cysteine desulfuration protein SufE